MQRVLQVQQALALVLRKLGDGDTCPAGDHSGDIIRRDRAVRFGLLFRPFLFACFERFALLLFFITQLGGVFEVLALDSLLLFRGDGGDFVLQR